jgi:alpha-1,3-rhamnosyl/mannosyltransferase
VLGVGSATPTTRGGDSARPLGSLLRLGAAAGRGGFDVFFFPAVYSYFPLLARTPCVVCYHDTIAEQFPELIFRSRMNFRFWQAKTALARLQTTRAMTVSNASAHDIQTVLHIPADRIDVITEAASPAFSPIPDEAAKRAARDICGVPGDADLLVYVGGFNRHKNVLQLLKALPQGLAKRPSAHLVLVGDVSGAGFWDNVRELQAEAAGSEALREHVHFAGYLNDARLAALLSSAAALVLPSLLEGFGLPAVEAMACGAPVLASRRGSLPEVVGDAGLLFDPESPDDIARCIVDFLGDPDLRRRKGEIARRRASAFSWERAAQLAEASFRRAAGSIGSRAPQTPVP